MDTKNVVQVQIFGNSYTIRGEAEQDYILDVAAYVDRKMREVTEKLPVASLSKVAVLASLNIADELFKKLDVVADALEGRIRVEQHETEIVRQP